MERGPGALLDEPGTAGGRVLAPGRAVAFRPADPPRSGVLVVYQLVAGQSAPGQLVAGQSAAQLGSGATGGDAGTPAGPLSGTEVLSEEIEVVLPNTRGSGVRRRVVPARLFSVAEALDLLGRFEREGVEAAGSREPVPGAAVWAAAFTAGLGLVARGRLFPSITTAGWDAWRAGPLDPSDRRFLDGLAASFPPAAFALTLDATGPLRLHSPRSLIRAAWDALADTLPRTAAAQIVTASSPLYAATGPVPAEHLRPWLADAVSGLHGDGGADVGLRVELEPALFAVAPHDTDGADTDHGDADSADGGEGARADDVPPARAVLQLTSRAESSLVVDAADFFGSPAAVASRFGDDAETDLVQALRRGARAWPPLEPLLHQRAPTGLALDDELLGQLLGESAASLQGAGIGVLWPSELLADGLALRASVTAAPGVVVEAGFDLRSLVEFHWQATLDGAVLSEEEVDQLAEAKRGLVRIRGRWVTADPELLQRIRDRRRTRLTAGEALGALLAGSVEVDGELVPLEAEGPLAGLAARLQELTAPAALEVERPEGLADWVRLRPYQARGVAWLLAMTETGLGGCLADDMGLGKTLQVIALHLHRAGQPADLPDRNGRRATGRPARRGASRAVARSSGSDRAVVRRSTGRRATRGATGRSSRPEDPPPAVRTSLVICPTSLVANWEREIRRFAPDTPVRRYHGPGRTLQHLAADEVVVTSYGVSRRDTEALSEAGFSLVVADEAQHAKNPNTATARALRGIEAGSRVALTGTPVENRLSDLWAILDWTTPGLLGPLERFVHTVSTPIERNHDPATTERLARTVKPFLLRRRKSDPEIAPDLPPRIVTDVPVPLTREQVTLYEAEVREAMDAISREDGITRQGLVLRMLTVLKQICNHPAQYLHQPGPLAGRSGKLAALEELVGVIAAEHQSVLVFSQFVECLALIEARLEHLGLPVLFLHGKVAPKRRSAIVDEFQAGRAPVLLLSLKVGGVGLNLTRASHVVHYDRWWNPATEDQATDRAHRIGQDRTVQVHRLVAEGTLEDRIADLLERKRSLAESVVGGGESWLGQLNDDELIDLVKLGGGQ